MPASMATVGETSGYAGYRTMLRRLLPAVGLLAVLGACQMEEALDSAFSGSGGTYDYGTLEVPLGVTPAGSVAITVIDERPYVVNGDEPPRFVGTLPGSYRQRSGAETASGRSLAEHVGEALAEALARQGAEVTPVPLRAGTSEAEALAALGATGAERLVVLRIREWQTMAQVRVEARWNLEASVHDRAGELLGRRATQGAETVGTTDMRQEAGPLAVSALARRLARLFGDPAITGALESA